MASDDEIVEMTLHSSEEDLSMEMDEREMHNLLDSKTGDPKPSSPLDLSQDGMAESTALTQCDEVPDTSEPDDDFVEVDQRVKEMVGDGKASLPSSSKEDPSTALTKVPNLSQGKEKEGEGKISSPSSSTEDPSTAPSKVLTQGENSGTSQSVTLAQVTDLLHAHVAETKHRFRNHSLRLAALEDPSPGVDAGTQTPTVPWRLKRRLTSESKANVSKHHERKEAGLARKGSLPSNLAKMGFVSYKKLKALVKKDTALEVLAQLGYPLELLQQLGYAHLLDLYAAIWLVMWANGGVSGIDSNLDEVFFTLDPTPEQADDLLSWACPAIHQWLADQPAASRQELHHPSQEKLKHDDLRLAASKNSQPAPKKARTEEPSSPKPSGSGTQPPTKSSASTPSFVSTDLRKNLEAKRMAERQNEVTMAFIRDRGSELTWTKGDISLLREWLKKNLRDHCLEPLRGSRDLQAARQVVAASEKARAEAEKSDKLKGKGKGKGKRSSK